MSAQRCKQSVSFLESAPTCLRGTPLVSRCACEYLRRREGTQKANPSLAETKLKMFLWVKQYMKCGKILREVEKGPVSIRQGRPRCDAVSWGRHPTFSENS